MSLVQRSAAGNRNTKTVAALACIEKNLSPIAIHARLLLGLWPKILALRTDYQIGALRIKYYLERYHAIKISESTVTRVLRSHGLGRLPKTAPKRALHTTRYAKKVPGHHVQLDVKFLRLTDSQGKIVKRYQYTAVDDATRIRALQVYPKHNQACAIQFID